jgi:hypothetical protein
MRSVDGRFSKERLEIDEPTFRKVNQGIEAGSDDRDGAHVRVRKARLQRMLQLSPDEYEAVRAHPRRFFALASHELLGVERVVERHDSVVVENVREAGAVAARTEPRRSPQS